MANLAPRLRLPFNMNLDGSRRDECRMAKLLGELLMDLLRVLVGDVLKQVALKVGAWLDNDIRARRMKIAVGLLLGLAAYFLFPIVLGILGL